MTQIMIAGIVAFVVSIFLTPVLIIYFRRRGFGQEIRLEGPQSHMSKRGTPNMGGLAILAAVWLGYIVAGIVGQVTVGGGGFTASGLLILGLATAQDAARYLDGVARTVVPRPRSVQDLPGETPAVAPADAGIWVASVAGRGQQELVLTPEPGSYVAVVMTPDGGAGVAATVDAGATLPWAVTTGMVALLGGLLLMTAGGVAITAAVRAATSPERRTAA